MKKMTVLIILLFASCQTTVKTVQKTAGQTPTPVVSPEKASIGSIVPAFTLTDFAGHEYNFSDWAGKIIVINFWASWCVPCKKDMAYLQSAWEHYESGGKVIFLGVDWVDTETPARKFIEQLGITYITGPDKGSTISRLFQIYGIPETYIIDRAGILQKIKRAPFTSPEEIQALVDSLNQ